MSSPLKFLFYPFSLIYGIGSLLYHKMYDLQIKKSVSFEIPVISIGNLSMGGSGKTPHVEYIIRLLKDQYQTGILSRGYKRKSKGYFLLDKFSTVKEGGDEPVQIKQKFADVSIAVCEERALGIPIMLLDNPQLQVIVLDDAFQHRQVQAGLSILLTNYSKLFTEDHLFPMGSLREPVRGAARADVIVVTKCPMDLSSENKSHLIKEVKHHSNQQVFFSYLDYGAPYSLFDQDKKLALQPGDAVYLFTAIADYKPLLTYLQGVVGNISVKRFPDHYYFSASDLKKLQTAFSKLNGRRNFLLTTEKDATRLLPFKEYLISNQLEIFCIPLEIKIFEEEKFDQLIYSFVQSNQSSFTHIDDG
ncbi:MAG: tetraacyldisaccharide 4'-kinase [Chitinophagales bacterium]|nr:tetraacyldisaccharide 4'-kinase [Chitinophagales bacterium]